MKKILLSIWFIISLTSICYSQSDSIQVRKKKWQIGINANTVEPITEAGFEAYVGQSRIFGYGAADHRKDNSYCLGLNISYKIKEKYTLRLSTRMTNYIIDETFDSRETTPFSVTDYIIDEGHVRGSVISISPAILWEINHKNLYFYAGFQMLYRKYNPVKEQLRYSVYSSSTNVLLSDIKYDIKVEGGLVFGAGPVAGFSKNIYKGISIGAEFSSAYSYYKTNGEITFTKTIVNPYPQAPDTTIIQQSYNGFKFSNVISSINISIDF